MCPHPANDEFVCCIGAQKRITSSAAKIVGHWLHRSLAMAYETWHEHAHAQERMRGILRRIAERWLHRDLAVAFTTWQENSDKQRRGEEITARIVSPSHASI